MTDQVFGLNGGFLLSQILSVILIGAWIYLTFSCLIKLRNRQLTSTTKAIWVLILLIIPVLGPVAFLIVNPGGEVIN